MNIKVLACLLLCTFQLSACTKAQFINKPQDETVNKSKGIENMIENVYSSEGNDKNISTGNVKKRISIIMVAGQSNAYGTEGSSALGVRPEEGTAFIWNNAPHATTDIPKYGTIGTEMTTEMSTKGKFGIHGVLAKAWIAGHPGEAVLIVNTSYGGSAISQWLPGEVRYNYAKDVFNTAYNYVTSGSRKELYEIGNVVYVWLQGEADKAKSTFYYVEYFKTMHNGFLKDFGSADKRFEFGGIIMVRAGEKNNSNDLILNGPRVAQYWMHNSQKAPFDKIFLISNITERWVDDKSVKEYFDEKYTDNEWSNMGHKYPKPSAINEVHPDIHYRQPGYNEIGKDAGETLCKILDGVEDKVTDVKLISYSGMEIKGETRISEEQTVVPLALPLYAKERAVINLEDNGVMAISDFGVITPDKIGKKGIAKLIVTAGGISKEFIIIGE